MDDPYYLGNEIIVGYWACHWTTLPWIKKHSVGLKLNSKWANIEGKLKLHHWDMVHDGSLEREATHAATIDLATSTKSNTLHFPNCFDYDKATVTGPALSASTSATIPTASAATLLVSTTAFTLRVVESRFRGPILVLCCENSG